MTRADSEEAGRDALSAGGCYQDSCHVGFAGAYVPVEDQVLGPADEI